MFENFCNTISRRKSFILTILFVFIAFALIFLGIDDYFLRQEAKYLQNQVSEQKMNGKLVTFLDFFIKKVLNSTGEVSFEDRLKLENLVRDLDDKNILSIWQSFTQAQTSDEVQKYCKELLKTIVNKISY